MPIVTGTEDGALVAPADLAGIDGAPFSPDLVIAVGEAVRDAAGWHIAPARTGAVENVDSSGGRHIFLNTLGLTAVTEVLDVTEDPAEGVVVTGYRTHQTTRFRAGVVERTEGWPCGVLNVTYDHGYDACPPQLLPMIAELCRAVTRGTLSQRSLGDKSESWRDGLSVPSQHALLKFTIPRSR